MFPDCVVYFEIHWCLWRLASALHSHQFTFRLHLFVCMCVLHRAQGVGGGFKTSLGKHKLQTVEITGVQTGRDPKQDPTFLCNPLPQACCLCSSFNGRKRQWGKTAKEGETKEMAGMFLMWLTETWLGWPRGPSAWRRWSFSHVFSAHLQDVHQFVGSSSSFLLHDSSLCPRTH